jgi:hypothetical protein
MLLLRELCAVLKSGIFSRCVLNVKTGRSLMENYKKDEKKYNQSGHTPHGN